VCIGGGGRGVRRENGTRDGGVRGRARGSGRWVEAVGRASKNREKKGRNGGERGEG